MAEKKINGRTFKVGPMPAGAALELYAALIEAAGPAINRLPVLLSVLTSGDESRDVVADTMAIAALSDAIKGATPGGVADLIGRVVSVAMLLRPSGSYEQCDLDGDFTGHLGDIIPLARFVLQVQFADFFPGNGANGVLGALRVALTSAK